MPPRFPVATPARLRTAAAALANAEPRFAPVIAAAGPCRLHRGRHRHASHFTSLASAIVSQQVSGAAAATIFARFSALFPDGEPTAELLGRLRDAQLRGAGLSAAKVAAVRDLAAHVRAETLPLDRVQRMPDADISAALVQVRGIGPWTAQMFLMFRLGRLDVWPTLDLGVQKGVQRVLGLRQRPTPRALETLGLPWAPHRSVAAWYAWRALELP